MKSLIRRFRRQRRLSQLNGRLRELEREMGTHFGKIVKLVPAPVKGGGGYDEVFYASTGRERFGVLRLHTGFKEPDDPITPQCLAIPRIGTKRLEREWTAYERLSPLGLSPEPLWRTHDAMLCSWISWERASVLLTRDRDSFWPLFGRAIAAARRMHDAGVVHLDLNWGNMMVSPDSDAVKFIDFEFDPAAWSSNGQQQAYDYLRLIEDSAKPRRGGRPLLADLAQLESLLMRSVPDEARAAKMGFVFNKLERLAGQDRLRASLERVFPGLNA